MSRRSLLWRVALHAAALTAAALTLLPLVWMIGASLMPAGEATSVPPRLVPSKPTLEHYSVLLQRLDLMRYLFSSATIAAGATALAVTLNSMAGYAMAKLPFHGRERLQRVMLAALVIPGQVGMLPLFLMLREMGLINTYWGVMVPSMASIFGIFLVRQYALSIPDALLDAARVDGAGELRVFFSIALPLCRPILVTLAVATFMGAWNDFLWPLIVLTDDRRYTLPVALANLFGEHVQDTELMMAGAVVTIVPVMLVFLALQRYYIAGMTAGSLKG
ncbi:MAG TPA: carbohydrate ABC transporter permease [Candidatus Limnocylindrales bacterium]|nr:carbohydrate ABC transporter permease [Candidatus Limnocylindrales bacterium]